MATVSLVVRGHPPTDRMIALGVTGILFDKRPGDVCQIEYVNRKTGEKVTDTGNRMVARWLAELD